MAKSFEAMHNDYLDPDIHLWPFQVHQEPQPIRYVVLWDNGNSGSGEFTHVSFDSFDSADSYGKEWADEMNAMEEDYPEDGQDGYTYEIGMYDSFGNFSLVEDSETMLPKDYHYCDTCDRPIGPDETCLISDDGHTDCIWCQAEKDG